ncbi:Zinc finger, UBR-type [Dillenia turbinata]|uniref:E3 ubiquitin-protein ligase n=1 Tax=Dillenia turbinata TaxID=194707 RepID=A0AAN8W849_9MAGN
MDIDSPPPRSSPLSPRDRIIQRLVSSGVPEELLGEQQPGLVNFVKEKKAWIPELVVAILPGDEDVDESVLGGPTLKEQFCESMVWLQWLMFEGEPVSALKNLAKMNVGQRGVCGAVWGNKDIAYQCRTCENDPTCAICVPCFQNGNHKDHDYSIIYTGSGCCDCGDETAWKREGFCSNHKGAEQIQPLPDEVADSVGPILDTLFLCWKEKLLLSQDVIQLNSTSTARVNELRQLADDFTFVVVEMLLEFCKYSESLLSFVSRKVFTLVGLLDVLVRAESFLNETIVKKLHELLLKLLGEPSFKYEFAKVYLNYYPIVVDKAISECSDAVLKKLPLISTFSVQILTVPTLTPRLVIEMNLLAVLFNCLGDIFISCGGDDGRLQVNKWEKLNDTTLRVVEDILFVMSHTIVSKYVLQERHEILRAWMELLAFVQGMNPHKRETSLHIEEENENMHLPFLLGHSIANIHSLLVTGAFPAVTFGDKDDGVYLNTHEQDVDDGDSIRYAKVGRLAEESSVSGGTVKKTTLDFASKVAEIDIADHLLPSSAMGLTLECLRALDKWLRVDITSGACLNTIAPSSNNISACNFSAVKKLLSRIRKGTSIFKLHNALSKDKFTGSGEILSMHFSSPVHGGCHMVSELKSGESSGQENKCMDASEFELKNASATLDESSMEEVSHPESDTLHFLSLSDWPDISYDVSSQDVSILIPLHRLLSLLLQKALRRCYGEPAVVDGIGAASANPIPSINLDFFGHFLGLCHPNGFSGFILENPLRIRVFCAQVHAGMWRKNGDAVILAYEWYRSVRWSAQGLELDLFLLQCCAALAPPDLYVTRVLERFGLSSYLSLNLEQSTEFEPVLLQEMLSLIIQIVKERRFCGLTATESLQRELVYKLATGDATHSQLVKSLPRDLSKNDQIRKILDNVAVYSHPTGMNQGKYLLRQSYWKELDLYHPRWNSKDLQVAEERYLRFCCVSPLTTQVPKWTKIYYPLRGVARIATCRVTLQIVYAVLYYAAFSVKMTASRAPDGVLITALHLLSLALDICSLQTVSADQSLHSGDPIASLAFYHGEIDKKQIDNLDDSSLLCLLVSLMRTRKNEHFEFLMEADNCNISSLIESLLKKFAELDKGCLARLQKLAPEVVDYLSQSVASIDKGGDASASDSEKRKAKARERQSAILEKMKAEQIKFMASVGSTTDDEMDCSNIGQETSPFDVGHGSEELAKDVCSLCHDPNSKRPLSFLILLQKSRLLSCVDKGPPLWQQSWQSKKHGSATTDDLDMPVVSCSACSDSELSSSSQLLQLVQNALNEFACDAQPGEIDAFVEYVRARFPLVRNIQIPRTSCDQRERIDYSDETLEEHVYMSIQKENEDNSVVSTSLSDEKTNGAAEGNIISHRDAESFLLKKYIAALSREMAEYPLASKNEAVNDRASSESTSQVLAHDGFGPSECDGIHLSSCGHAVHQGCLDRYRSSLKERPVRRMVFEGGHTVNPDEGEFLCPVCRGLANSVLPALPGNSPIKKHHLIKTGNSPHASGSLALPDKETLLHLREGLFLLQCSAKMVRKKEIFKAYHLPQSWKIKSCLKPVVRVLSGMYFPGGHEKFSRSARNSPSIILWDTLRYSIVSAEIAARCARTSMTPVNDLESLYDELKSSTGFIYSLLLKIVQSVRSTNAIDVLLRFRGVQLFAESICSGISVDKISIETSEQGGHILRILKHMDKDITHSDIRFWKHASGPILAQDPFSSLMWAVITCCKNHLHELNEAQFHDTLITDIFKYVAEPGAYDQYFVSKYIDLSYDLGDMVRRLSFPYLRRCALLWKLVSSSTLAPFSHRSQRLDESSYERNDEMDSANTADSIVFELIKVEELENMFKIPPFHVVLRDKVLRSLVSKWFHHFQKEYGACTSGSILHVTPTVPFRLMQLPHVYQDVLERYIKQQCPECKTVLDEPGLCLLCGRLCSPSLKLCCRDNLFQTHAKACGAGTGRTEIMLIRSTRQAFWPSPYLDAYGEEDIEMSRGKPLFLNEERYAALAHMVASHGLDRSSKVLQQTTMGVR